MPELEIAHFLVAVGPGGGDLGLPMNAGNVVPIAIPRRLSREVCHGKRSQSASCYSGFFRFYLTYHRGHYQRRGVYIFLELLVLLGRLPVEAGYAKRLVEQVGNRGKGAEGRVFSGAKDVLAQAAVEADLGGGSRMAFFQPKETPTAIGHIKDPLKKKGKGALNRRQVFSLIPVLTCLRVLSGLDVTMRGSCVRQLTAATSAS